MTFENVFVQRPAGSATRAATFLISLLLHMVLIGTLLAVTLLEEKNPMPALAVEILQPSHTPAPPAIPISIKRFKLRFHGSIRQVIPNRTLLSSCRPVLMVLLSWLGPDSKSVLGMMSAFLTKALSPWINLFGSENCAPSIELFFYSGHDWEDWTTPLQALKRVIPDYPKAAQRARIQDTVTYRMGVNKEGTVKRIVIIRGNRYFNDAAVAALRQWRFEPDVSPAGRRLLWVTITFIFALEAQSRLPNDDAHYFFI